ncbi:relaxase/mobilization nuclease domain-containing protein [Quadrisphaera setariae]|uniref:MobA/VirD2-like nuclease domain-containing protein n=1 Tax=Quadrisphaera setariae TaxID=2593304 RepID=A0A5C8Z0B7_9ACTN|nr:hypothetical protein [Quadrisphaera setariae]TXR51572.1 hypothetical protein FMM08_22240 [Quadrisphaera setariae]
MAGNVPGRWQDQAVMIDETVAARPGVVKGIWRTSLRAAPQDRVLSDGEWGQIATGYISAMGLTEHPWTATRHGEDHIHLTVSRVSWAGTVASLSHDFTKAQTACRSIEVAHQLIDASARYDRARPQISHGERERGQRLAAQTADRAAAPGRDGSSEGSRQLLGGGERERLRELVGTATALAAASGRGREGFEEHLTRSGVLFRANVASTGRVSGYSYGLDGHVDAGGTQVFFKGSQLGKDYTWAATSALLTQPGEQPSGKPAIGVALKEGQGPVPEPVRETGSKPGQTPTQNPAHGLGEQSQRERLLVEHHAVVAHRQQLTRDRITAQSSHRGALSALEAARRALEVASRSHREASADWQQLAREVERTAVAVATAIAAGQELSAARRAREQLAAPWAVLGGRPTAAAQRAAVLLEAQRAQEDAQAREVAGRARMTHAEGAVGAARQQVTAAQAEADRTGQVAAQAAVREQRATGQLTAWEVEQAQHAPPSPLQQALDRARGHHPGAGQPGPWRQPPGPSRGSGPSR